MSAADVELCAGDGAGTVEPATGAVVSALCASDLRAGPTPTPLARTPRPQGGSPDTAAPVVPLVLWRTWTPRHTARLGPRAWAVWCTLLELRDKAGDVRATAAGIGRRLGVRLAPRQVQRQLDRLNALGLLAGGGWRVAEVPFGRGTIVCDVYERRVLGDRRGDQVALPAAAWERIERAGRGGARPGAGRKPRIQTRGGLTAFENAPEGVKTGVSETPCFKLDKSKAVTEVSTKEKEPTYSLSFLTKRKRGAFHAPSYLISQEPPPAADAAEGAEAEGAGAPSGSSTEAPVESVLESSSAPLEGWLPVERDAAGGVQLAGGGGPALYRTAEWAALPPCPGPAVIAPALIPAPPLVRPELDEAARVALLLTAYGQVCRRRLPTVWNPYARGAESLKPKERAQLVAAAAVLQAHEVSPRRWVEFAWDQWTHGAAEDGSKRGKRERSPRPPLKVLFSPARIEEQAGWCRRERERRGGQLVLTRTHRHLLDRWQAMTRAVMRRELSPAEAVAKHLPPETWARLVAKATAEAKETQAKISSDILSGADLW